MLVRSYFPPPIIGGDLAQVFIPAPPHTRCSRHEKMFPEDKLLNMGLISIRYLRSYKVCGLILFSLIFLCLTPQLNANPNGTRGSRSVTCLVLFF